MTPTFTKYVPPTFFQGKLETFLTCRALAEHLKENIFDEAVGRFFEEAALNAVYKTMVSTQILLLDFLLLLNDLPNFFKSDYPIVKNIVKACLSIIPKVKDYIRNLKELDYFKYQNYYNLEIIERLLKNFDNA